MIVNKKKFLLALVLSAFLAAILAGTGALVLRLSGSTIAAAGAIFACLSLRLTLIPCLLSAWYVVAYTDWPFLAAVVCIPGLGRQLGDGPRGLPDDIVRLFREAFRNDGNS